LVARDHQERGRGEHLLGAQHPEFYFFHLVDRRLFAQLRKERIGIVHHRGREELAHVVHRRILPAKRRGDGIVSQGAFDYHGGMRTRSLLLWTLGWSSALLAACGSDVGVESSAGGTGAGGAMSTGSVTSASASASAG